MVMYTDSTKHPNGVWMYRCLGKHLLYGCNQICGALGPDDTKDMEATTTVV
uniref:Uncharacterized protein n=1 Tax=Oryza sativa subsp. japonica TaxID=39947 RepID=Q6Z5Z1_ORYSJ|nr:hypothetical protein [Oryza sativa Japonica Group]